MAADEVLFRIREMASSSEEARLRERFAVTAREAEVLLWIGRGKATRDIAEILGMSPRTVQKHLEQIYAKLGVENRAAAAAMVTRSLSGA
jgi:DNA-binding CsgD family transcriptional regulator